MMPSRFLQAIYGLRFLSAITSGQFAMSFIAPVSANRPSYHITPETKWLNDPQRPFFLGGEWHLYYLWNSNWNESNPGSGGTEWYHVTSVDMVQWTRRGVAIRKYQPNPPSGVILGDIETGS